ncbi:MULTISPECIES: ribonuclease H-like domain-containing protein [Exiguobacterium]|uniref:ribonuclease H-like domain-containing protein n=1 Tax=Exiguobacterium TaxID=33986 RepID=UPI001BE78641|nr:MULTISPECIES: ribonuclease H-like domain-containing protein [Exiguobacterium]MCT4781762.1 ribonuclease H-like domain-containing protein [Exiguobacterium himgiriensis]
MKAKLARLIKTTEPTRQTKTPDEVEQAKWTALGGEILKFEKEWCVRLKAIYPLEAIYHDFTYAEARHAVRQATHPFFAVDVPIDRVLFMDTETTGLRGSGTSIFLIGFARIQEGHLEMVQYVLPHPAFETAFYYHFLNDIGDEVRFVTYNGKSFDWPQIKTRHTFVKSKVKGLPAVGHVDLLHASRRLLKPTLESVSLKAVEAHFGHERVDDLPGFLAPMHYFQYVKEREPDILRPVIEHHHADCLSLVSLYTRLTYLVEGDSLTFGEERAHWLSDLGNEEAALKTYAQLDNPSKQAKMRQALLLKRAGRMEEALPLFEQVDSIEALTELAKYAEHKQKDIDQAYAYTERALELLEARCTILKQTAFRAQRELQHRLARLERKRL